MLWILSETYDLQNYNYMQKQPLESHFSSRIWREGKKGIHCLIPEWDYNEPKENKWSGKLLTLKPHNRVCGQKQALPKERINTRLAEVRFPLYYQMQCGLLIQEQDWEWGNLSSLWQGTQAYDTAEDRWVVRKGRKPDSLLLDAFG